MPHQTCPSYIKIAFNQACYEGRDARACETVKLIEKEYGKDELRRILVSTADPCTNFKPFGAGTPMFGFHYACIKGCQQTVQTILSIFSSEPNYLLDLKLAASLRCSFRDGKIANAVFSISAKKVGVDSIITIAEEAIAMKALKLEAKPHQVFFHV